MTHHLRALRRIPTIALIAAVAAPAAALAQAQSGVVLFGVMDEYLTYIKPEGAPSVKRLDSSGLLASRWGIRVKEDLGDGLAANAVLEFGINANLGAQADANRSINRQSWAGLSGNWGEVRLGRQNTPQFYMNGKFDAFNGATQASGFNNITGTAPRVDNAIGLFTPNWGGVTAQVLVARGATGGAPIADQVAANQNVHAAVEYENKTLYVGGNYENIHSAGLVTQRYGLGTSYAFAEKWRVFGAFGKETRNDSAIDLKLYSLSALWQVADFTNLAAGWTHVTDGLSGAGHGGADQYSVLARYLFSKRTTVYAGVARLQQHELRNSFSLGGAAVVAAGARPTSPVPGGSIDGLQLGITHLF